ncbi:RimK family alpha-L-glutamate ligase [Haloarculaceae archaeon H-GB1-1]|nr:RimK family alpha-L-glutamate ligase [Haloarculaceae archaeon H-GB1-1]
MPATDSISVGVLSLHNSKETKAILNAVEGLGHEPVWLREENSTIRINSNHVKPDPAVDVLVNRLLLTNTDHPEEQLGLLQSYAGLGPMLNRPLPVLTAIHKFATATKLARNGVPVPDALLALNSPRLNDAKEQFGPECVYKTAIGTHGGGTWKVGTSQPLNARVGQRQAFLQAFLESHLERQRDLRVYVVGDEIIGAMYRYAPEGDWRTNASLGGDVENATDALSPDVTALARKATDVVGLDYAGVDLIEGDDGWAVLKVNTTAGFRALFKATGRSVAPHIAKLAIETAGGDVESDRVSEITRHLDDSEPSGKPSPVESPPQEAVTIGYTEDIVVSGTSGSERVIAKSDTGASRTSIDTDIAAAIGAGPVQTSTTVRSAATGSSRNRPVVDVVIGIGGTRHTVAASIEDRSHMEYPVLLGRDILSEYSVDVDKRVGDTDDDSASNEE